MDIKSLIQPVFSFKRGGFQFSLTYDVTMSVLRPVIWYCSFYFPCKANSLNCDFWIEGYEHLQI